MSSVISDFVGGAEPLSSVAFSRVQNRLEVEPAAIWAVLAVETSGCGFLPDRRPKILFERHVFHKQTAGRFDLEAPDLSDFHAGGYGAGGAHQFDRLARAVVLDRTAALKSASWGLGQTMGFNFAGLGFPDVGTMVKAMMESEDHHLDAMAAFIEKNGIDDALRDQAWEDFASVYNGPAFKENNYDGKLDRFFWTFSKGPLPDLTVRAAQVLLSYLNLNPGSIDGVMGDHTRGALGRAGLGSQAINDATIASLKELVRRQSSQATP